MPIKPVLTSLDLRGNEIRNAKFSDAIIEILPSAPINPKKGQIYYDATDNKFKYYNGTTWIAGAEYSASSIETDGTGQYQIYDSTD